LDKNDISNVYQDVLTSRNEVDPNGTEDVVSFIDKESKVVFSYTSDVDATLEDKTERKGRLRHEHEHRLDLLAGRAIDEARAYEVQGEVESRKDGVEVDSCTLKDQARRVVEE